MNNKAVKKSKRDFRREPYSSLSPQNTAKSYALAHVPVEVIQCRNGIYRGGISLVKPTGIVGAS